MRNAESPSVNRMADELWGWGASFSFFFVSSLLTVVRLGFFQFFSFLDAMTNKIGGKKMEHKHIGKIRGIDYDTYLKSEAWHEKRMMVARLANFTCQRCHREVYRGFHIHHLSYRHFGDEPLCDLLFLCEDCHKAIHEEKKWERKANGSVPKKKKVDDTPKEIKGRMVVENKGLGCTCPKCGCGRVNVYAQRGNFNAFCSRCGNKIRRLKAKEERRFNLDSVLLKEKARLKKVACKKCGGLNLDIYSKADAVIATCRKCKTMIKVLTDKEREKLGV